MWTHDQIPIKPKTSNSQPRVTILRCYRTPASRSSNQITLSKRRIGLPNGMMEDGAIAFLESVGSRQRTGYELPTRVTPSRMSLHLGC